MNNIQFLETRVATIKHQLFLFFPLVGVALLTLLFPFLTKILLGRFSIEAMEAVIAVSNVCNIVKVPCVATAFMAQVYIGRFAGANTPEHMGPCIWQMMWFSILSMMITVPISLVYGHYYFAGTPICDLALPYLYLMTAGNFLFPLGAALSCFYLGNRRGKELLQITFVIQAMGFGLAYLLIFGIGNSIPPLGVLGAGIAFLTTQMLFCLILLKEFLQAAPQYASSTWRLHPTLLGEYLRPGLARALSRWSVMAAWSVISYFIIHLGDDFLLALTLGGAIWEMSSVLTEGLLQLTTTEVSHIIGSHQSSLIGKPFYRGLLFSGGISVGLALPFLMFPQEFFHMCFSSLSLSPGSLNVLGIGLWICFTFDAINVVGVGYVLSFKDTFHLFTQVVWAWLFECGITYVILKNFSIQPSQIWLIIGCGFLLTTTMNLSRAFLLKRRYSAQEELVCKAN